MTIVKFLDGSLVQFDDSVDEDVIHNYLLTTNPNLRHFTAELLPYIPYRNDEDDDKDVDRMDTMLCAFIHPAVMILNRTQGNYIYYYPHLPHGDGGEIGDRLNPLNELFGERWNFSTGEREFGRGHWGASDHIVYVPDHLREYVEYAYARLHIDEVE
jgi:hypothetical protein